MERFESDFEDAIEQMATKGDITPMKQLLQKELPTIAGDNFNYI